MIKFIKEPEFDNDTTTIEMTVSLETPLDEVIEEFKRFLIACSYGARCVESYFGEEDES